MKTIRVKVTFDDIMHGHRFVCDSCPIARALKRAARWRFVAVGKDLASRTNVKGQTTAKAKLPQRAQDFISAFDFGGATPKPFEFNLSFRDVR